MHQATLNESLMEKLQIPFDYVAQSMFNSGTSDADGREALNQALLKLGFNFKEGDEGFLSKQFFFKGDIDQDNLEAVSQFLANPNLYKGLSSNKNWYMKGEKIQAPIVTLPTKIIIEKYDITNMSDDELLKLNSDRKLAANLHEMKHFASMYEDKDFLDKRKEYGLDHFATDIELEGWFGNRSEHCFHKEFNAKVIINDKVEDKKFKEAFKNGSFELNDSGEYVLGDGIFKTFIEAPAKKIFEKLEKRGKNWIADMFVDNAGTVFYDENYMYCIKFETHNSPSNKEPVNGAKTGIDGVNRDIFGNMKGTFDAIANFFLYSTGTPESIILSILPIVHKSLGDIIN